ncbi:GerMN domain-containing protein [Paeniglutamicibacter cryotolerans]|uniref:GerMN domain-containing protein n=1 Tax=Paeniglutamicibacter cryotolerans TaxID=670079 RepID=A0A839QGN4_9MICC|nr:GerMN domain-containing protein [Paeniglutamicibacter cryotolerans]MBB2994773.1 hypothetical protein [Paeniglutamicibacter cryotolerans]
MPGKRQLAPALTALLVALAGCAPAQDQMPAPSATGASSAPVTATAPTPGMGSQIPTMRPSASDKIPEPSASEPGSNTVPPTGPPTTADLTIYYVAVGDRGKSGPEFGCGDSIVAIPAGPRKFTDKVGAALELLLSDTSSGHGDSGLTNAVASSTLAFVSSSTSGQTVTVNLRGHVSSGGACEDQRIIEQLSRTAATAASVQTARILVNGIPISMLLNGK